MMNQKKIDYARIEKAIRYICNHRHDQPSLHDVAAVVNLSPFHFQRLFSDWAGVSPKKFIQYLSLEHAKQLLRKHDASLLDVAHETGLSGTSRLHDLFVGIEGMTPGQYKNAGLGLNINYSFSDTPFGKIIVASTAKGICHMYFVESENRALQDLKKRFPNADFYQVADKFQQDALLIFQKDWRKMSEIKLHLAATPFQLKVWESLLKIPMGTVVTYKNIAQDIGSPKAARAVGTAIAGNPVAFLIPCHRVIQGSGHIGKYHWGETRKSAIIAWESAKTE